MNKTLAAGLAALGLVLLGQHQAMAWHKCSFGIGLNFACEGGGNCILWGLCKGANVPCPHDGGGFGPGYGPPPFDGHAAAPFTPGPAGAYAEQFPNLQAPPANANTNPPKQMPLGSPTSAQAVGYYPYAAPAVGYYTGYYYNPGYYYPAMYGW
jgi:hypothetical protein